jgi:hypothetical protein
MWGGISVELLRKAKLHDFLENKRLSLILSTLRISLIFDLNCDLAGFLMGQCHDDLPG